MILPTPVLLLVAASISFPLPSAALPLPPSLSFRIQNVLPDFLEPLPTPQASRPLLRIIDDSSVTESYDWDIRAHDLDDVEDEDSIFHPNPVASDDLRKTATSIAITSSPSVRPVTFHNGRASTSTTHLGCPALPSTPKPSKNPRFISLSPLAFSESLCGRRVLVKQEGHSTKAVVAGKTECEGSSCGIWDVALSKKAFDEMADISEGEEAAVEEVVGVKWRLL